MLSGLSSQWSLTLVPMIWEWMGLCKSTLRSIPSCLFGTKRGYSCFHPITVKKKKTALLIIFLSQSHQFPTRCLYQKYFLIGGSGGLFLSPVPQLCQTVKLICQNTTYTSHKMQIRDQSKFRRDIRAKLLHEVCITVKQSFHFYFPHDSIFFVTPTSSLVLLLLFDYAARTRRSNGSFKWTDTLGHRKYHRHINHCSYKTKAKHTTYIAEETIRSRGSDKTELQRVHFSALNRVLGQKILHFNDCETELATALKVSDPQKKTVLDITTIKSIMNLTKAAVGESGKTLYL